MIRHYRKLARLSKKAIHHHFISTNIKHLVIWLQAHNYNTVYIITDTTLANIHNSYYN